MTSFLLTALRFPAVAAKHGDLLRAFVKRDLAARYEGSLLGKLWPVLHPAMLLGVYSLVFAKMLKVNLLSDGASAPIELGWVTTFFMLSGILPWICTVEGLNRCTPVVVENSNLIKKVAFPSELLPTYTTLVTFFQMLIGFALFIPLYVTVILLAPGATLAENAAQLVGLAWFPVAVALQFVFVTGLGMLLSAVNVFVRDVAQVIPLATLIWMFFTPIFYRFETIETSMKELPWLATTMKWNPLYHLLALYRGCFAYERGARFPYDSLAIFTAIAVGVFILGHGCFHRWKGLFADEV